MDRMELRSTADPARGHVVIELWQNGKPLGHIRLAGSDVENHIRDLAKHRAMLVDEVPFQLDPVIRIDTLVDPAWRVPALEKQPESGRVMLLRHPGLGWLSFLFPHKEAAGISKWLGQDLPPDAPDKSS